MMLLKTSQKFTGTNLCQSLFFNKVAPLKPVTLLKKRLWHSCFPVNFATFLRTLFYRTPPLAASGLIECLDWAIVVGSHLKQPQKR